MHPAGTSGDSDSCDIIKSVWICFYNGGLWEFFKVFSGVWKKLVNVCQK